MNVPNLCSTRFIRFNVLSTNPSNISTEENLPACCGYIELDPFRAAMVIDPAESLWSIYACKVTGGDPFLAEAERKLGIRILNKKQ